MSLFVGIEVQDGGYLIAVDSRASVIHNGISYCTSNDLKKYVVHNNKLIITFGSADVMKLFQNYCTECPEETNLEKLFDTVINSLSKERIEIQKEAQTINLLSVFEFDITKKKVLSLHYTNTCERIKRYDDMKFLCSSGMRSDEAIRFLENYPIEKPTSVFEVLQQFFNFINCSSIGGTWTIFHITDTDIKQIETYDSGDRNVTYTPINILYDIKKTEKYLSSAQIIGTDVLGSHFYNKEQTAKLELGMAGNLGDLKLTRTADGTTVFQIYDDATVTTLRRDDVGFLSTSGKNTYMLGKWLYKDKEIATQQNIKELEDRIKTLETRLQNLETSNVE